MLNTHPQQVEDTLNNSNELFLTFRKEMEEMSKKTKRLEKENLTLTRKHDQTNRNILEMAEERTRDKEDLDRLRRQETQMRGIIKSMQDQGRGLPGIGAQQVDDEVTESEYEDEYDDELEEGEYEDDEDEEDEDDIEIVDDRLGLGAGMGLAADNPARQAVERAVLAQERKMREQEAAGKPVFGPVPPPGLRNGEGGGGGSSAAGAQVVNGVGH
jgi:hypothetical protein